MLLLLNKYVQPDFDLKPTRIHYITTHNNKADAMNTSFSWFKGRINYLFPEIVVIFQTKYFLSRKSYSSSWRSSHVCKNDLSFEKNYFNGKMGIIKSLSSQEILVHFPEENKTIEVDKYEWQNIRYKVDALLRK
jgi:hypothetical protein